LEKFESELLTFPNAAHDDQVDNLAWAVAAWQRTPIWAPGDNAPIKDWLAGDDEDDHPGESIASMTRKERDPARILFESGNPFAGERRPLDDAGRRMLN
jgi:hypothetical protein